MSGQGGHTKTFTTALKLARVVNYDAELLWLLLTEYNVRCQPPWSEKELRKGRPGLKVVQIAFVRRKGKKVKAVISQKVKRKPVARILAVGPQSGGGGSAARLNWSGLANCESNNNPKAVNPAGYYGLYQFSMASWASVGGQGRPSDATPAEQTYRAQLLYNKVNGRWQGQWPNCGRFLFS